MKNIKTPPQNISFRLVSTQSLPKNKKLAIYFCKELNKYFSVDYGKEGIQINESEFSIIEKLKNITDVEPLYFNDGSTLNIDKECSKYIIDLYEEISDGKLNFEKYINDSNKHFLSILDYSVNKFKKET